MDFMQSQDPVSRDTGRFPQSRIPGLSASESWDFVIEMLFVDINFQPEKWPICN